uniref:Uncharacterized protein n=1 Tax=Arundo donax TaxID=35708 RepID=A0A0A9ADF3_ARUDO
MHAAKRRHKDLVSHIKEMHCDMREHELKKKEEELCT